MHPIFGRTKYILLYLLAWIPLGALLGVMLSIAAHLQWREAISMTAPLTLVLAFLCLSPWYTCRSLPLGAIPAWKLLARHVMAAICASAILLVICHILLAIFRGTFAGLDRRFLPAVPVLAGVAGLLYLLSIALHYVMLTIESSRRAEILSREAELKALKAQVNPHFLFNSLHSISALTTIEPARARDMCLHLSEFLRKSLRLGERVTVPFGEELALTKTYLDVEQVRFGTRLRIKEQFDPACSSCEVPPLIIQPLVENAIKHGVATLVDGGEIAMAATRSRDILQFVIENSFDPEAPSTRRNGFGLSNVRNRLQTRYGNAARMDIQVQENRYRVVLLMPAETTERDARTEA